MNEQTTTPQAMTESDYWVPVTREEVTTAKIKVSASSPEMAIKRARAVMKSFGPGKIMTAMGRTQKTKLSYGVPWQRETIETDTCPPMTVTGERRDS